MRKQKKISVLISFIIMFSLLILNLSNATEEFEVENPSDERQDPDDYDPKEDIKSDNPDYERFADEVKKNPELLNELPPEKYLEAAEYLGPEYIEQYCDSLSDEDLESIYNADPPES